MHSNIIESDVRMNIFTGDAVLPIICSSVTFILTAIFCLTIGCLCQRLMRCTKVPRSDTSYSDTNEMYEEVPPIRETWQRGIDLQLKENGAYKL